MGIGASREAGRRSSVHVRIVRPGGKVDRCSRSVSAKEVMRKNPKHWVVRSEVFRSEIDKAILAPEEMLMPDKKYYLVPNHTLSVLLKRKGIDKREFAELLSQVSSVYGSPIKIQPVGKAFLRKCPRKNWPRTPPARMPLRRNVKDAEKAEDLKAKRDRDEEKEGLTTPPARMLVRRNNKDAEKAEDLKAKRDRDEEKKRLTMPPARMPVRRNIKDAEKAEDLKAKRGRDEEIKEWLTPQRTLAEHLQSSPLSNMTACKREENMQNWYSLPIDQADASKPDAHVVLLVDSAQAILSRRKRFTRNGRSPGVPLYKSHNMSVRRRAWVPRLQTLPECSP